MPIIINVIFAFFNAVGMVRKIGIFVVVICMYIHLE